MPIYEYQCQQCGTRLEKLQKVSDLPLTDCPACGEMSLQKMVSKSAFHLKGSGWYVTDFKDQDKSKTKTETKTDATDKSKTTQESEKISTSTKKTESPSATPQKSKDE